MSRILPIAVAIALVAPVAAHAQFSDSYNFLKAVRDNERGKVVEMVSKPGSTILETKDSATGETALHIVTKKRDLELMNFFLVRGAKADARDRNGNTALLYAVEIGFLEGADILLKRKASVDLPNSGGETPLIRAVHRRDVAMARLLVSKGANPDKRDRLTGKSARDYAKADPRAAAVLKIIEAPQAAPKPVAGPKL